MHVMEILIFICYPNNTILTYKILLKNHNISINTQNHLNLPSKDNLRLLLMNTLVLIVMANLILILLHLLANKSIDKCICSKKDLVMHLIQTIGTKATLLTRTTIRLSCREENKITCVRQRQMDIPVTNCMIKSNLGSTIQQICLLIWQPSLLLATSIDSTSFLYQIV